jgi:hypothetical protein
LTIPKTTGDPEAALAVPSTSPPPEAVDVPADDDGVELALDDVSDELLLPHAVATAIAPMTNSPAQIF